MIKLDTDNIYHVSDTRRIIEEALKKGTCYKNNNLNYYNIIAAFDIETSNIKLQISDNSYKDIYIYNYLHGITIRCIDVDILLFGDNKIDTEELTVPHKLMYERDFVMEPLREIAGQAGNDVS